MEVEQVELIEALRGWKGKNEKRRKESVWEMLPKWQIVLSDCLDVAEGKEKIQIRGSPDAPV